jgi:hypothetical protein
MNFGRPGEVITCVGCHAGHSMIPVPSNPSDAQWTNLATGAAISVSSLEASLSNGNGLIDRRVKMPMQAGFPPKYWLSRAGQSPTSQWVQLTFPVPVTVRTVRLYNIPGADSSIQVQATTVKLFGDATAQNPVASNTSGALSDNGTDVTFNDVAARVVRIEFNAVNGSTAGLAEVEVIARAGGTITSPTPGTATNTVTPAATLPTLTSTPATPTFTFTPTAINASTRTSTPVNPPSTPTTAPTSTAVPPRTATPLSTFTAIPSSTSSPVAPPASPVPGVIPPTSITTERGTTSGSLTSLGSLRLSGTDDHPAEYVTFQTPGSSAYSGYFTYRPPASIPFASVSSVALQVNFKGTAPSKQTWSWLIYDWQARQWVKLGEANGKESQWKTLNFNVPIQPQYGSPQGEVRIQLRSNNSNGDAKIDYQVLQWTAAASAPAQTIVQPAVTSTATSIAPSLVPTQTLPIATDTPTILPSPTLAP